MDPRYQHDGIRGIWSRARQLQLWRQVELAWMTQLDDIGWMDAQAAPPAYPDQVDIMEEQTRHEFVAFLEVWTAGFKTDEARRWVHYGLTSSDVIDTATALQIRDTNLVIVTLVTDLQQVLQEAIERDGSLMQVGRTHGQQAQPRLLSTPLSTMFWMLQRASQRLNMAMVDAMEVDFSGPTGGRSHLDARAVGRALDTLGLHRSIVSTQIVPRDSWAHYFQTAASLVSVCEAIAEQYWLWSQTEISEVEVTRGAGSSAMPHKRGNPHRAENVMGLGRLARAMLAPLAESVVQRGDRDLAHSSVERVLFPDLSHLIATALQRTIEIITDYQFAPEYIEGNLVAALDAGIDSANRTAALVREGWTRADAMNTTREEMK